jgi:MFS transporter, DHA1 family, tetracycline resistance protein
MSDKKAAKLPLLLIFLTVFIDLIGFGIIIPLMPLFAEKFGASASTVGLLLMSYSLMQFIFTPVWGRLSDKIGRRPVLLISLTASAIGYLIWAFSNSLEMLFVSRLVAGFGNANLAVAQAYISDVTTPENRAKGMGMVGAAFGLGFVLGPAIGGIASHLGVGLNHVGFIAAAFSIIDLVLTAARLPEPENRSQAGHDRFRPDPGFYFRTVTDSRLALPIAIFFISTFAFANMEATLVLLTERYFHYGVAENSWMFAYIGIVIVFVQGGLIGRLSKKLGEKPLVAAGTAMLAVGLLLTPATKEVAGLYVALGLLAVGSGINTPANQSILSKLADPDKVGGVMGVGQSVATLGRILGPIAGGFLFEKVGVQVPYIVGAVCMAIAFLLSFGLPKTQNPAPAPQSARSEDELGTVAT